MKSTEMIATEIKITRLERLRYLLMIKINEGSGSATTEDALETVNRLLNYKYRALSYLAY